MEIHSCYFCDKLLSEKEIADNYDDVYYVCKKCLDINKENWETNKELWSEADYRYDEY